MKKLTLLTITLLVLSLALIACSGGMNTYEKNLGEDYKIKHLDKDDIEDLADAFDIDSDDYAIKNAMRATHEDNGTYIIVFECSSESKAKELLNDLDYVVDMLDDYYSSIEIDAVRDDTFVFIGCEDVIDDALDR